MIEEIVKWMVVSIVFGWYSPIIYEKIKKDKEEQDKEEQDKEIVKDVIDVLELAIRGLEKIEYQESQQLDKED
tara:strand:+ start:1028 stop:1246 length:219 start_codon:yes stop_codon:yes gene_type:complete